MSETHHNPDLLIVAGLVIAFLAGWVSWRSQSVLTRLLLLGLSIGLFIPSAILGLGMNPWLVDARYRSYRLFYWDIQRGMDRAEVLASLDRRYPLDGPRLKPRVQEDSATRLSFIMNPEKLPDPDRETIIVTMEDGKVLGKEYLPDNVAEKKPGTSTAPGFSF